MSPKGVSDTKMDRPTDRRLQHQICFRTFQMYVRPLTLNVSHQYETNLFYKTTEAFELNNNRNFRNMIN
jgi:hypothetical protein